MEFFKINGKIVKSPKEITISPEHLDNAERTLDGTMVIDIIGTKKKVDVSWEFLCKEDMTTLTTETGSDKFSEITFHDNKTGELTTITARAENLTYMPYYDWTKGQLIWKSVSVSFKQK